MIAVAISTTGHEHRLPFLETAVFHWCRVTNPNEVSIFVTVDGTDADAQRVADRLAQYSQRVEVHRVGQGGPERDGRQGVAVNKNTGLELAMHAADAEHIFLVDDDVMPRYEASWRQHITLHERQETPHSMVCWGLHRLVQPQTLPRLAQWSWPRGVMLYVHRSVVETVGGFVEDFGVGGHEHVEWSNRIHNAGLTPAPYVSPASFAERAAEGLAMRASALWRIEDMRKPGEPIGNTRKRKKALTSIQRTSEDWAHIEAVMERQKGSTAFVPYRAHENGRESATLYGSLSESGEG